ncbi:MAG: serine/threonine protein kinase, partial [Anaerolineae bacterium]|nr:serine/threonine protein kinase [Anaerolineae bacterium]
MNPSIPPVPQTERTPPPLSNAEAERLLSVHHKEDMLDLFANDPDREIRQLGQIALRRSPLSIDDAFALGDLCAQRVLLDDQLRVFYVGKALAAYRRAASRAANGVDRVLAERAVLRFAGWVCAVAQALPDARNIAVALWAAAEVPVEDQPAELQERLIDLLRIYPVGPSGGITLDGRYGAGLQETVGAAAGVPGITDTQDEFEPDPRVYSDAYNPALAQDAGADFAAADGPTARAEGAFSAVDMPRPSAGVHRVPAEAAAGDEFVPGERIEDRYEVAHVLRGGMGVVYLCYDHEQRAPVAIKSFQSRFFGNERAVARFVQEALTWIRLEKHTHIVQARLVRTIKDRPHIFLEHVSGPEGLGSDLQAWIDHSRISLPQAVTFALHIALGMQHAVRKVPGLVHRDLKPANILVSHDEVAKVTDFGLVRSVDAAYVPPASEADEDVSRLTRGGAIVGTAPYMSPEQCRAEDVDERSDIYAFGCIL